jgi:hypothetical protein
MCPGVGEEQQCQLESWEQGNASAGVGEEQQCNQGIKQVVTISSDLCNVA